jgi:cytochrome P450
LPPIGKVSWLPEVIDFGKEPVEYLKEARRIHGDVFTLRFSPKTSWHFVTSRSGIRQLLSGTDRVYEFDEFVPR